MMEHRWGERFPLDWQVRLRCGTRLIGAGRLRDISVSGAFVLTDLEPTALAPIEVEVRTPMGRHVLEAFVVRFDEEGVGVEWSDVSPALIGILLDRSVSRIPGAATAGASLTSPAPQRR